MTIYVHRFDKKGSVTLHNVESVVDDGPSAVRIKMQFGDNNHQFDSVRNVVIEPTRE